MISAGGIPIRSTDLTGRRPVSGFSSPTRRPVRVADEMSVQSGNITLNFGTAMMGDMLKNAVLPAANRAFGNRFSSYADAIAFLKQCGYSSLRSLPKTFQKSFTSRMLRILKLRYPAFKKNLDRYFGRFSGKGSRRLIDDAGAKLVYGTVYKQTQVVGASGYKCPGAATPQPSPARPAPLPLPRPVTTVRPRPRPAVNQIKLQRLLIAAVRTVPKFRKYSGARARGVLKYSWGMLKIMGVAPHIQRVFRRFSLPTAPEAAETKLREILRNWQTSSGSVQPSRTPPRPVPVHVRPSPRPVDNQLKIQDALIKAVKKVRGFRKYSDKRAKGVLKYSWGMLKIMKVASHIQKVFAKYGPPTAAKNEKKAAEELKRLLATWK